MQATKAVKRQADRILQVRITEELKQQFDTIIAAKGYNKSAVLRKMLIDWIAKETSQ